MAPTIVGLGGSLASGSKSRAALQRALDGASAAGAETRLLDLRELALPIYNPDHDEPTEAAAKLIETCYAADGLLWSSPLYQGTISGALKNALDWLHLLGPREPPYLHDKGNRADQRRRSNPGATGDQYDGVRRARAARMGGAVRRTGRGRGARVRPERSNPGRVDRTSAHDARRRGRARRRTLRSRQFPSPRDGVCVCSREGRERWITSRLRRDEHPV
jgi:hypothetical protein